MSTRPPWRQYKKDRSRSGTGDEDSLSERSCSESSSQSSGDDLGAGSWSGSGSHPGQSHRWSRSTGSEEEQRPGSRSGEADSDFPGTD